MNTRRPFRSLHLALSFALLAPAATASLTACDRSASSPMAAPAASPETTARSEPSSDPAAALSASRPPSSALSAAQPPASGSAREGASAAAPAKAAEAWSDLVRRLSEPDAEFFSDNTISNETSYLQASDALTARARGGGAYIGVGPEQNFTYIAQTKPEVAFIIDIRRQNMLLHLLYKAMFEEASSRAHFLALLLGRRYDAASEPGPSANINAVLAAVEKSATDDEATFSASHARLRERIERGYGVPLDTNDKKTLEVTHRSFFQNQLELRFELHKPSGRRYPTLRELLSATAPDGAPRGFLAVEDSFRFVQKMHADHRIVPVVGNFAGDRAMPGIAAHLKERKIPVSAFYVSNVEQYLFEPGVWPKWMRNVAALPSDDKSLFIRAYLDQGRRHPSQMKGHRTATILQRIVDFNTKQEKKPFQTFWAVVTEDVLDPLETRR